MAFQTDRMTLETHWNALWEHILFWTTRHCVNPGHLGTEKDIFAFSACLISKWWLMTMLFTPDEFKIHITTPESLQAAGQVVNGY